MTKYVNKNKHKNLLFVIFPLFALSAKATKFTAKIKRKNYSKNGIEQRLNTPQLIIDIAIDFTAAEIIGKFQIG